MFIPKLDHLTDEEDNDEDIEESSWVEVPVDDEGLSDEEIEEFEEQQLRKPEGSHQDARRRREEDGIPHEIPERMSRKWANRYYHSGWEGWQKDIARLRWARKLGRTTKLRPGIGGIPPHGWMKKPGMKKGRALKPKGPPLPPEFDDPEIGKGRDKQLTAAELMVLDEYFRNGRYKSHALRECHFPEYLVKTPSKFFNKRHIKREIGRRERLARHRYEVNEGTLTAELAKLAYSNISDFLDIDPVTGAVRVNIKGASKEQLAALKEITVDKVTGQATIKIADKVSPLQLLLKKEGLLNDKLITQGADADVMVERLHAGRRRSLARRRGEQEDGE